MIITVNISDIPNSQKKLEKNVIMDLIQIEFFSQGGQDPDPLKTPDTRS